MNLTEELNLKHSFFELPDLDPYYFEFTRNEDNSKVYIFPQLHDQIQFSALASKLMAEINPTTIAVELPKNLEKELSRAIDRLPIATLIFNDTYEITKFDNSPPDLTSGFVVHPGEAMYWSAKIAKANGIDVAYLDNYSTRNIQSINLNLDYFSLALLGWQRFWESGFYIFKNHVSNRVQLERSYNMVLNLLNVINLRPNQRILVIVGAAHWPILAKYLKFENFSQIGLDPIHEEIYEQIPLFSPPSLPKNDGLSWQLADIHPHTLHFATQSIPFFIGQLITYEQNFNTLEALRQLYFEAEEDYNHQFDDNVSPASYRRMFQYLRNLGRIHAYTIPPLYEIITGAKGMVDDDYAFEVYKKAVNYPFVPDEEEKLSNQVKFKPDESQGEIIRLAFKRRYRRPQVRKIQNQDEEEFIPIPEEEWEGQWREIWDKHSKNGYVSYPPEDVYIENYMGYLRKRINEILKEEKASSIKFEASLEDGIDYRATARHFHDGDIYVKKLPKGGDEVGVLVVQFLEEPYDEDEYNYHSTLFAEHDLESHISVITTKPGDLLVGPGITRVKYAAIISQYPPVGWPALVPRGSDDLKTRLVFAGMNMALTKVIGFVSPKPPSGAVRHFAAEYGFRIVYLPMSQLTKASLHRLRSMHLLVDRSLRDQAREYIGF